MATLSSIQEHFKVFGKLIYMSIQAPTNATSYKKAVMGTIRQGVSTGASTEYSVHSEVLVPMQSSIKGTIAALNGVPAQVKSTIDNYLRRVVATDLEMTGSPRPAEVAAELVTSMTDNSAHVGPSGVNANGFAVYFTDNYAVTLPQDASPNCPDSWIDDDVV